MVKTCSLNPIFSTTTLYVPSCNKKKTLDLELFAPVTGEKAIVQIKAQSDLKQFLR
jgi:hypothetical protein